MDTLILAKGQLTPSCSKTHITYCFNLKKEYRKLNISFSYSPKSLEDREKSKELILKGISAFLEDEKDSATSQWESFMPINNLLTISIDDSNGIFRGCGHRQSPNQNIYISEDKATPGFIPGKIFLGQWKITISAHAVITDTCNYTLHIRGEEKDDKLDSI